MVPRILRSLSDAFGHTENSKGFRVINHNVKVIQGDGINPDSLRSIIDAVHDEGYSLSCVSFGMGGGLLQQLDRDTQRFAFKCSSATVDGEEVDVFKDPVTDKGKQSKRGLLDLNIEGRCISTVQRPAKNSGLINVFENGKILKEWTFEEVRKRSRIFLIPER